MQMGSYLQACTNETYYLTNLQYLIPTLGDIIIRRQHKLGTLIKAQYVSDMPTFVTEGFILYYIQYNF